MGIRAVKLSRAAVEGPADVKSARRVLDILELLGDHVEGLTFPEIADRLHLAKSSLHALLATMVRSGWITLDPPTRNYRVGSRTWEAGQAYQLARQLVVVSDRHLRALCHDVDQTVQLAILDDVEILYIARVDTDHPFQTRSRAGSRFPAWASGLGKVLLASLPVEELRARMADVKLEAFTDKTICDLGELEDVLERIRREGIGRDDGELSAEVRCVAAPVLDQRGNVVAAVSCSAAAAEFGDRDHEAKVIERLKFHAAELSKSLGWRPVGATIDSGGHGAE